MKQLSIKVIACVLMILAILGAVSAQGERAATLEVISGGVEMLRVGTDNWIAVNVETVVGVGDVIRTDETGVARITFFSDGVDTDVQPSSEYRIDTFEGDDTTFTLQVSVLVGQTTQRLQRILDAASTYSIETPGMTLAARGTEFAVRVEDSGRAAMLVTEGVVDASNEADSAEVPAEFGIRSEEDAPLSDVVRASSFEQLDNALDGCSATVTTVDDVSINVRSAPSVDAEQIGFVSASEIDLFYGRTATTGWYRIDFEDGFGWILASAADVSGDCGLREFPDDFAEDGAVITPSVQSTEDATEATAEPTEAPTDEAGDDA